MSSLSRSTALLLLAALLLPSLVQAQSTPDRTRFLRWAYQDAIGLTQEIGRQTPWSLLGTAAVLAPLSTFDAGIDYRVHKPGGAFGSYLDATNELGGPKATLPVAGIFAASLLTHDARLQDAAFTSFQSLVYAGALSYGIKRTVGRFRPYEHDDAYHFVPFSGRSSFPSGHTVTAFAVLTPWVLYYPHPATYGLFALSTGTALSRVAREKHWATDVLAGGALGFLTAYWLTRQHQGATTGRLHLTPSVSPGALSLSVQVNL